MNFCTFLFLCWFVPGVIGALYYYVTWMTPFCSFSFPMCRNADCPVNGVNKEDHRPSILGLLFCVVLGPIILGGYLARGIIRLVLMLAYTLEDVNRPVLSPKELYEVGSQATKNLRAEAVRRVLKRYTEEEMQEQLPLVAEYLTPSCTDLPLPGEPTK